MAEKRGLEEQNLINDFNTAGCLEVFSTKNHDWYRVTSKDFRAWNGPRRITAPVRPQGRGEVHSCEMHTYEYYGPVYTWGTNNVVDYSDTGSLAKNEIWEKARKISENRSN